MKNHDPRLGTRAHSASPSAPSAPPGAEPDVDRFAGLVLQQVADGVLWLTGDGRIRAANPSATRLLGYAAAELRGLSLAAMVSEEDRAAWADRLASATARTPTLVRLSCRRRDGTALPADVAVFRFGTNPEGPLCAVLRDVTEEHRLRDELRRSREAAEMSGRAKIAFLASLSHEIRTPMNTVLGLAELLWETPLTPDQRKYVRMLRRAGSTLLTLLNDIQDLSRVEAGRFTLDSEDFLLDELLDKTLEIMTMRANEKGLDLAGYIAPDVPCELVGDPNRLQQILVNLVGNAIKFTERGEIVLRVEREPGAAHAGVLRFSVADTGIGIADDERETIFESFAQGHGSTRSQGSGLGLAIAKQLVTLMGGHIWLESAVGRGSTFYFTVPLELQPKPSGLGFAPAPALRGLKVLIADPNPTHRLIVKDPLAGWGAAVSEAASATELLSELQQAAGQGAPYQLLLLDRRLPDLDCFRVAETIQRDPALQHPGIIILTSETWADDIARTYDSGVGAYLVKPIRRSELVQAVTIALKRVRDAEAGSDAPHLPGRPLNVLLVDDSPDSRFLITSFLDDPAFNVDTAENGQVGLRKFKAGAYDLVLMDLEMPVMDGCAASRAIRRWESAHGPTRRTPIIALTATGEEARSLEAGCTAHLTKPITKKTLLRVIEHHRPKGQGGG